MNSLATFIALGVGAVAAGIVFLVAELARNNERRATVSHRSTHNVQSVKFDGSHITCCAICLDPYGPEHNLIKLNCMHKFHGRCILDVLISAGVRPVCPICRKEIDGNTQMRIKDFK